MQIVVLRNIEERIVRRLKQQAQKHGISMEEEHRGILRESLFPKPKEQRSFKDFLLNMPDVGDDSDFCRSYR